MNFHCLCSLDILLCPGKVVHNCFKVNSSTLNQVTTVVFTVSVLWRDFYDIILKQYNKSCVEEDFLWFSFFLL